MANNTGNIVLAESSHAALSASYSWTWHLCNGAIALGAGAPDRPSIYAANGTVMHDVSAQCLSSGGILTPADFIGKTFEVDGFKIPFTEDFADMIGDGYIKPLTENYGGVGWENFYELQVNQSVLTGEPYARATSDHCAISADRKIFAVGDLKTGRDPVPVAGNWQMICYAYAGLWSFDQHKYNLARDVKTFEISIYQPPLSLRPDTWIIGKDELINDYVNPLKRSAWNILNTIRGDKKIALHHLNPGEKQCKWCRARETCPARAKENYAAVSRMFSDERPAIADDPRKQLTVRDMTNIPATPAANAVPDATQIDISVVIWFYERSKMIRDFLDDVEKRLETEAEQGTAPGYKLVEGKPGHRAWISETAVYNELSKWPNENDANSIMALTHSAPALLSVAQMEKALKKHKPLWQALQGCIVRPQGKPKLAREDDPKPAIGRVIFNDETQAVANDNDDCDLI